MAKFGFIGMGNMGYAMLKGMLKVFDKDELVFTDANHDRMKQVFEETGVNYALSNGECANQSEIVILAIKPQYYSLVLKNIENIIKKHHIVISLAPTVTIDELQKKIGPQARIVRVMPNTPALIGAGITGVRTMKKIFCMKKLS
jgi:pyrroline-5-carboxylate reductase